MKKTIIFIAAAIIGASLCASLSAKKRNARTTHAPRTASAAPHKAPAPQAVDLGLGVKWASHNLGAASPADFGNFYSWGELHPKKTYTEDSCSTFGRNYEHRSIAGDTLMDAATRAWGAAWRLPSEDDIAALIDSCTWTPATVSGHKGYNVKGPSGNSIFLPVTGIRVGDARLDDGDNLYYWSSIPISTRLASILSVQAGTPMLFSLPRNSGLPIRAVTEK